MSKTKVVQKSEKYVYTPQETAMAGYKGAERAIENARFGIALPHIDGCDAGEYFAPLMPWEICAVLGQTHNGKTLFVDWWEHGICEQLAAEKRDEVVVHVSLEESLEAMSFQQHARYLKCSPAEIAGGKIDLKRIEISVAKIATIPIYRIADSQEMQEDDEAPELYLTNVYRICKALVDGKVTGSPVKIAAIVLDYLQALPYDPETRKEAEEGKRRIQVRKDVYRLRKMTVHMGTPIIVNVQAKQKLEGATPPYYLPGMYDGEETSSIAQRFDRLISVWMPKTNYPIGSSISGVGDITDGLFYLKANKQRGGFPSGKSWACKWDFERHQLVSVFGKTMAERDADAERNYIK